MTPAAGGWGPDWSASLRRASETELRSLVDEALAWSDEADGIALEHFRRELDITHKPDRTLVTQADQGIERRLRDRIADAHPDHGVLGEEEGARTSDASSRWILDPIDGTHNFVRGIPLFATLLALERDGEMQLGVVSAPALRERWFAWRGGGAWSLGSAGTGMPRPRRLRVSGVSRIDDAQVLYGSARDLIASGQVPGFATLLRRAWRERGFGDFWGYALVAEGAAEAMIEIGLSVWDLAAPLVVLEEAGGRLTDYAGHRSITNGGVVASNGRLHDDVLAVLAGTPE